YVSVLNVGCYIRLPVSYLSVPSQHLQQEVTESTKSVDVPVGDPRGDNKGNK
ncbi:hypothetical protein JYU34_005022, partial [Plutella xylostella]